MKCPRCGAARQPADTECRRCGIDFAYVEKKLGRPNPGERHPGDAAHGSASAARFFADPHAASKTCPKCAFPNPGDAEECLRCGIIFDQYATFLEKQRQLVEEVSTTTDGLIDPEQLRVAIAQATKTQPDPPPPPEFVKTRCPHCRQRYRIRPDQIGVTTRCRRCSSIFKTEPLPPAS